MGMHEVEADLRLVYAYALRALGQLDGCTALLTETGQRLAALETLIDPQAIGSVDRYSLVRETLDLVGALEAARPMILETLEAAGTRQAYAEARLAEIARMLAATSPRAARGPGP